MRAFVVSLRRVSSDIAACIAPASLLPRIPHPSPLPDPSNSPPPKTPLPPGLRGLDRDEGSRQKRRYQQRRQQRQRSPRGVAPVGRAGPCDQRAAAAAAVAKALLGCRTLFRPLALPRAEPGKRKRGWQGEEEGDLREKRGRQRGLLARKTRTFPHTYTHLSRSPLSLSPSHSPSHTHTHTHTHTHSLHQAIAADLGPESLGEAAVALLPAPLLRWLLPLPPVPPLGSLGGGGPFGALGGGVGSFGTYPMEVRGWKGGEGESRGRRAVRGTWGWSRVVRDLPDGCERVEGRDEGERENEGGEADGGEVGG
jgi:hypothetical protein